MSGPSRHIASPHDLGRGKARNWSSRDSGTQSAVRPGARSAPRSRMRARSITGLARCYRRNARLTFQVLREAVSAWNRATASSCCFLSSTWL